MKNKYWKLALVLLLCFAMLLPYVPMNKVEAKVDNWAAVGDMFKGKKLSILGDSISTYAGASNDSSVNSTIGGNAVYYTANNSYGVVRKDTWWQQAIDAFGMELCVNNSWSGSAVFGDNDQSDYYSAWKSRCKELDNDQDGDETAGIPDIIAVYLGTNDVKTATSGYTQFSEKQFAMISEGTGTATTFTYKFSKYVRMIHNMINAYPNAEIYCFTLLPNESQTEGNRNAMEDYNQSIRDLVTYFQGQNKKVYLVDLHKDSGVTSDLEVLNKFLVNCLHPNDMGMDAITNCFLSSLVANSQYKTGTWQNITYDLNDVYVQDGKVNKARYTTDGNTPFSVSLLPTQTEYDMDVKVTMGGKDVTATAYSGGRVYLEKVTGDVTITANATYETKDHRWELKNGTLVSCTEDGNDYNVVGGIDENTSTLLGGSYSGSAFSKARVGFDDPVVLRNEEPWVIEWSARGTGGGSMLLAGDESVDRNVCYVYHRNGGDPLAFGFYNAYRSKFWNFGFNMSSKVTLDSTTYHTYRLVNDVSGTSNMIHLYIDDVHAGTMDNYNISGEDQGKTDDWVSGRDFVFPMMGSVSHPLNSYDIQYLQIWEGGDFDTLRLEQLIEEYDELSKSMSKATGFDAYQTAVTNAKKYLDSVKDKNNSQTTYDTYVSDIVKARNELTKAANTTAILSMELVTGNYVPIGKPAGLKIITTPDVKSIQVGKSDQTLIVNSTSLQTLKIDGVDMEVKVWLVSWMRDDSSEKSVEYRIYAFTDAAPTVDSENVTSELAYISFGAKSLTDLKITVAPNKTTYNSGESFDPTGMEVTAYYANGSSKVITNYTVSKTTLSSLDTYVTVTYNDNTEGKRVVRLPIKVNTNVSQISDDLLNKEFILQGYYVGVAQEGRSGDNEILIKDISTDRIIAVRGVPGTFPNYGYRYGDLVSITGTLMVDGTASTPNKQYVEYSPKNSSVNATIVSRNNTVTYNLDDTVKVSSWDEMQKLFAVGAISEYTFVEFTAPVYMSRYVGEDEIDLYRLHLNGDAGTYDDLKTDGTRYVSLRANVMEKNLGTNWLDLFLDTKPGTAQYPGPLANVRMTALYTGANGTYFQLTILDDEWVTPALDVSTVLGYSSDTEVLVEGYYVGVAEDGLKGDQEMLIKDIDSDDIIAVRNVPGTFPDYQYEVGDKLEIKATLKIDGTEYTPNKRYLDCSSIKVLSRGNDITYQLNDVVKVSSWSQMQKLFAAGAIDEYTYIEFTGPMYFHKNVSTQGDVNSYRLYLNASATGASGIRPDGSRSVALRDNVMAANIGDDWKDLFFGGEIATTNYPGATVDGTLVALYTGGNSTYYQLTILDKSWIGIYDNEDVLTEVAYSFYNQGTAIQYDQTEKRRNMNPSPEDATAQNPIYLDCSSYVNAVYYEAFGVNVMPYTLSEKTPTTENYTTYAMDNGDAVDVIGYWENADYTTAAAITDVLAEVRDQLQVGDVLVYRHGTNGSSGHVYVYVGDDTFLHCSGASYVYNDTTPSESYDYGTMTETGKGAIQIIDSDSIFTSGGTQSSKRYLFNSGSDPVVNFSLLRPLARGLTPTKKSIDRMKIAGLEAEKSVDVGQYNDVCAGDTLAYTVTLTNDSYEDVTNVSFKDTLPSSVAIIDGSEGMVCSGQNVSWSGTVKAGMTVTLTYTVKVSETATAGTLIESDQASVCGVEINDLTNTVSGMSDSELAAIAELAKEKAANAVKNEFKNPMLFVQYLYEGYVGDYETVSTALAAVIDTTNNTCKTDTDLSKILVPNLYGGMNIKEGYYTDAERARLVIEDYLAVGDVIIAADDSKGYVWVYVGDGQMVYIDSPNDTCTLVDIGRSDYYDDETTDTSNRVLDNILATLISYERYAILRPSMAA